LIFIVIKTGYESSLNISFWYLIQSNFAFNYLFNIILGNNFFLFHIFRQRFYNCFLGFLWYLYLDTSSIILICNFNILNLSLILQILSLLFLLILQQIIILLIHLVLFILNLNLQLVLLLFNLLVFI
jgi:hypothetical protein